MSCPRKFYWKYERSIVPIEETVMGAPAMFGIALHKALEYRAKGADFVEAMEAFRSVYPESLDPRYSIESAYWILHTYYERYANEKVEYLESEYEFTVQIGNFAIKGRFDQICYLPEHKTLAVMDHKSTSEMGEKFYDMCNPNNQFSSYIYAADCEFGNIDSLVIDGILVPYTYKRTPKKGTGDYITWGEDKEQRWIQPDFERVITKRTEMQKEEWKCNMSALCAQIDKWADDKFWPAFERAYVCANKWSHCPYRELCLVGGDPETIEPPGGLYGTRKKQR